MLRPSWLTSSMSPGGGQTLGEHTPAQVAVGRPSAQESGTESNRPSESTGKDLRADLRRPAQFHTRLDVEVLLMFGSRYRRLARGIMGTP